MEKQHAIRASITLTPYMEWAPEDVGNDLDELWDLENQWSDEEVLEYLLQTYTLSDLIGSQDVTVKWERITYEGDTTTVT